MNSEGTKGKMAFFLAKPQVCSSLKNLDPSLEGLKDVSTTTTTGVPITPSKHVPTAVIATLITMAVFFAVAWGILFWKDIVGAVASSGKKEEKEKDIIRPRTTMPIAEIKTC